MSGRQRVLPRWMSVTSRPCTLTAQRSPARTISALLPWRCRLRARVGRAPGMKQSSSPSLTAPEMTVPVMTVPCPLRVNTRSTGRRKMSEPCRGGRLLAQARICSRRAGMPWPVLDETGKMGVPSRKVPCRKVRTSSWTSSSQSASTMSTLVRATKPCRMPSREQISRCSRVWGMTPSSAAMTSMTESTPAAPATMFLTKRSWPGTSTMPRRSPPGMGTQAKPSSMVMPRRFSSSRRSQSMPVSARTRDVLPWSM